MILVSGEFTERLKKALAKGRGQYIIASAFIKVDALKNLAKSFSEAVKDISVIARWQKRDLVAGVSDLEVYRFCTDNGWRFGIDTNLHGKLYLVDRSTVLLGSANVTDRGLSLSSFSNNEFGTELSIQDVDFQKIRSFIRNQITWIDNEIYQQLAEEVEESLRGGESIERVGWSNATAALIVKCPSYLWVDDLLFSTPQEMLKLSLANTAAVHDFKLLGLAFDDVNQMSLKRAFLRSKVCLWLQGQLRKHGSMRFGHLSKELHGAIMDDPAPYRREVKYFVGCIFAWAEFAEGEFEIRNFSRTQAIDIVS